MPRNKAIDAVLAKSKELNREAIPELKDLAEPEGGDNPSIDPTETGEEPEVTATPAAEPAADQGGESPEDKAAREAAEAEAAKAAEAEQQAREPAKPTTDEELRNARAQAERLKREREEARRQLAEARRQLQERTQPPTTVAAPAKEEPKAPEDPEPAADQYVEHQDWAIRQAQREAREAREEAKAAREEIARMQTGTQQQQMESQFDGMMSAEETTFKTEHPDIDARIKFLSGQLRAEMLVNGVPEHQVDQAVAAEKRKFLVRHTALANQAGEPYPGQYALERLSQLAEARGYREDTAAPADEPKPKQDATPAAKIQDRKERAAAARSASTMGGQPVGVADPDGQMTAEKFQSMTMGQRLAYKKKHPDILDRLFSEGEEGGGVHPLLMGR